MIRSKKSNQQIPSNVLEFYCSDDQLIPFYDNIKNEIRSLKFNNLDEMENYLQEKTIDYYWRDIGGEGA